VSKSLGYAYFSNVEAVVEPEPPSPRNRNRVPKVSASYRSHGVQHEPGPNRWNAGGTAGGTRHDPEERRPEDEGPGR
jgi:hypothetical protein